MVFYFTGTGNSLYIAKQIEKDPVSIPEEICKTVTYSRGKLEMIMADKSPKGMKTKRMEPRSKKQKINQRRRNGT